MKKIIIFLLLLNILSVNAYMPLTKDEFVIGKIEKIDDSSKTIKLNNYINYKLHYDISNYFNLDLQKEFFNKIRYIIYYKVFNPEIQKNIFSELSGKSIDYKEKDLEVQKGDIVLIDNSGEYIFKIVCNNDFITIPNFNNTKYIFFSKNDIEFILNDRIGCNEFNDFFLKNRSLQDLYGRDLLEEYYILIHIFLYFLFSLFILLFLLFFLIKVIKIIYLKIRK